MKKILVFAGSNSRKSINKKLVTHAASLLAEAEVTLIDLNDYEMPLYSIDREKASGIPEKAKAFLRLLEEHDGYLVSLAEHNGSYSVAFKNIFDWVSRVAPKVWGDKPLLLLSTSPGKRGGASVMEIAKDRFPRMGAKLTDHFSLPSFGDNFSEGKGITDEALQQELAEKVTAFESSLVTA